MNKYTDISIVYGYYLNISKQFQQNEINICFSKRLEENWLIKKTTY